ncbi:MAG: hypothetical protein ACK4UX_12865 [Thiobacillus sp.]
MTSDDLVSRLLTRHPSIAELLSDIELPEPPGFKTNDLLGEQLEFFKALSRENNAAASLAIREARRANIIAIIAAIMATIGAMPVIIDMYKLLISLIHP